MRPRFGLYGKVGPAPGFTWDEVRCRDGSLPLDIRSRRRYVRQARYLNRMRKRIARKYGISVSAVSITVTSWFRSPSYNAALDGSATMSQHVEKRATDIVVSVRLRTGRVVRLSPRFVGRVAARSVPAFAKGGIGVYPGFTHLDHRPNGPARW